MFRLWQHRIYRHRENVHAANCCTNLSQYEKEVAELAKFTSGHQRARRFKREEAEERMRKDNERLVQKICEVARESERRQVQIATAAGPNPERSPVGEPQRRRRQHKIDAENARLLKRLESVKSEITSKVQSERSYDRHV